MRGAQKKKNSLRYKMYFNFILTLILIHYYYNQMMQIKFKADLKYFIDSS